MDEPKTPTAEEITAGQPGSADGTNEQNPAEDTAPTTPSSEGQVTLSAKEAETLRKKAADFDGLIEKQRLQRLAGKSMAAKVEGTSNVKADEVVATAVEAARQAALEVTRATQTAVFEENLAKAYRRINGRFPWLSTDEATAALKSNFDDGGELTEEKLYSRLLTAVERSFPDQYRKSVEDEIRAKVIADANSVSAGSAGGVSVKKGSKPTVELTSAEQALLARQGLTAEDVAKNMSQ